MKITDEMSGELVNQETVVEGYKDADGIKYPHKIKVYRNGTIYEEMEITQFKPLEKVDDKEFARPS
jgi:hypothetical protein